METKRTRRVNNHAQRKLDIARARMREYLLDREIDGVVQTKDDMVVVHVTNPHDAIYIPITCRGVNVVCLTSSEHD